MNSRGVTNMPFRITALWDSEAQVWVASSDDDLGLGGCRTQGQSTAPV